MRKFIFLALLLASFTSFAQSVIYQGNPTTYTRYRGSWSVDSILAIPIRDTTKWMNYYGNLTIRPQDRSIWYRPDSVWIQVGNGGSGNDTSNVFTGTLSDARSLTSTPDVIVLTDYGTGVFVKNDTVTVDNTGTQIITAGGQGYSRVWDGENVYTSWFADTIENDLSGAFIAANNIAKSGNKVIITAGEYKMLNPITTKSGVYYDFTGAKVNVNTKVSSRKWITLDNVSGVTIDGIELIDTNTTDVGFSSGIYINGGNSNTIRNVTIDGFWETNIRIDSSINFLVEDAKLFNCFYRGARTEYYSTGTFNRVESAYNGFHGIFFGAGQMQATNCYTHHNSQYGLFTYQDTINTSRSKITLLNNRSEYNTLAQISLDYYTSNAVVSGNVCRSSAKNIPSLDMNASTGAAGIFSNNIIVENNSFDAVVQVYRTRNISFKNNTAYSFQLRGSKNVSIDKNQFSLADTNINYVVNFETYSGTNCENIDVKNNIITKGRRVGIRLINVDGYVNILNNTISGIVANSGFGEGIRLENLSSPINVNVTNNTIDSMPFMGIRIAGSVVKAMQNTMSGTGNLYSIGTGGFVISNYLGENKVMFGTAIPTTGNYVKNDKVYNVNFSNTTVEGWVCTVSGSPGTWIPMTPNLQNVTNQGSTTTNRIDVWGAPTPIGYRLSTTAGVSRWDIAARNTESGSNTGSDLTFNSRDDAGNSNANVMVLDRRGRVGIMKQPGNFVLDVGGNTNITGSLKLNTPTYTTGDFNMVVRTDADSILRVAPMYSKSQIDSLTNGDIKQNGNSFGTAMNIGTNDSQQVNIRANNATRATFLPNGEFYLVSNSFRNNLASNNALIQPLSTGTLISRNFNDSNPSLIVNQNHSSSTGNILSLQKAGVTLSSFDASGRLTRPADYYASGGYGFIVKNSTNGRDELLRIDSMYNKRQTDSAITARIPNIKIDCDSVIELTYTTVDTASGVVGSIAIPNGEVWDLQIRGIGVASGAEAAKYLKTCIAGNVGGTASILYGGVVEIVAPMITSGMSDADLMLSASSGNIDVKVRGVEGRTINWKIYISVIKP